MPLKIALWGYILIHAVVDPKAKHQGDLKHYFEDTDETTTDGRWSAFRDVDGEEDVGSANTETGESTARIRQSNFANHLEDYTNYEDDSRATNCPASAEALGEESSDYGAEESLSLKCRYDVGG